MNNNVIEIKEAIAAGERALSSLYVAQEKLNSARGWGMFDLFGGGLLADIMKHSRMDEASSCMEEAKRYLQIFKKELADVNGNFNLSLDVSGFLSFADFFFDGLVADYLVQSKIADARKQVDNAIEKVSRILDELKKGV